MLAVAMIAGAGAHKARILFSRKRRAARGRKIECVPAAPQHKFESATGKTSNPARRKIASTRPPLLSAFCKVQGA